MATIRNLAPPPPFSPERVLQRISSKLRWDGQQQLNGWADALLTALAPEIGLLQAALYASHNTHTLGQQGVTLGSQRMLRKVGAYACPADAPQEIALGQGLTGEVLRTGQPFYLQGSDANDLNVGTTAGSGFVAAGGLAIVPLWFNQTVRGVLEVATAGPLITEHRTFLAEFAEPLAAALHSLLSAEEIRQLLQESEQKAAHLAQQEARLNEQMTNLRQTQQALDQEQARLVAVMDTTYDTIWVVDRNFLILHANLTFRKGVLRRFGHSEVKGKSLFDFLVPDEHAYWRRQLNRVLTGEQFVAENTVLVEETPQVFEHQFSPIYGPDGQVREIAVFSHDVTTRHANVDTIRRLTLQLEALGQQPDLPT